MKMSNKFAQRFYILFGFIFLLFSGIFSIASINTGIFPAGQELVMFGVSVMTFCLAYLYPKFKENDERSKLMREKGMVFSYFLILGYMLILMGLFQFNVISFNGYQTVCLIATLTIITVFLSFVIQSKKR